MKGKHMTDTIPVGAAVTHRPGYGWIIRTLQVLEDSEAASISWPVEPQAARLGEYVEIVDPLGVRIGRVNRATLESGSFGQRATFLHVDLM
jgi:hypothetical protein